MISELTPVERSADATARNDVVAGHVVVLASYIPAYMVPVYRALAQRVERLTLLLSAATDANHKWDFDLNGLDVAMQRVFTVPQILRHSVGFKDITYIRIPWDTLPQLRRLQPDIVLSEELGPRTAFSSLYRAISKRVRLLVSLGLSEHTEQNKGRLRHVLRKFLLPRADALIVNGHSGVRYLQKMGYPAAKIHRFTYCALPGVFDQLPVVRDRTDAHRMLAIGQLIERKGLLPLLAGLSRWGHRHPDRLAELTIAGSGPLESQLRSYELPSNVVLTMVGYCNFEQLADLSRRSGIFVFPTLSDDWGLVVNEAMAAGLPVLGSVYSQAVDDLCVEGETGWRFRTDYPDEMDRAIEAALDTSHEKLDRMRVGARRHVEHITPEFTADQFAAALRSCG